MESGDSIKAELIGLLVKTVVVGFMSYYSMKLVTDVMDPTLSQRKKNKNKAADLLSKLGMSSKVSELNEYELTIASDLLNPSEIDVTFNDIAGLSDIIEELEVQVIMPLCLPEYFESNLRQPPRGVLFHGPPGCGKTMLAKAIAKEASVRFINLSVSVLTDKWYGESQKLAQAVFTLALKIQPCIIFIDEIDSFLRSRDSHDHEATAMMKAQFMTLWEGLLSSKKSQIVLIGATNRPQDVDAAVLRRMPCMFQIDLPNEKERQEILELILKSEKLASDVDLAEIASQTYGYSGSDLKDLCRRAAMKSIKELNGNLLSRSRENSLASTPDHGSLSSLKSDNDTSSGTIKQAFIQAKESGAMKPELRSISMADFIQAINAIERAKSGIKPHRTVLGF